MQQNKPAIDPRSPSATLLGRLAWTRPAKTLKRFVRLPWLELKRWGVDPEPRRFHAYCVGLPKTGTTTLAATFKPVSRAAHEPLAHDFHPRLRTIQDDPTVDGYLLRRDRYLGLEFEASHFLHAVVGRLTALFPDATFVLTVREPTSWLESMINEVYDTASAGWDPIWRDWDRYATGPEAALPPEESAFADRLRRPLNGFLRYWSRHIDHVLDAVPRDRLMVLDVRDIDSRVAEVADFIGLDGAAEPPSVKRSNTRPNKAIRLSELSPEYVDELVASHCAPTARRLEAFGISYPCATATEKQILA